MKEYPTVLRCADCRKIKSVDEFYSNKKRYSGHNAYCKECDNRRNKFNREKFIMNGGRYPKKPHKPKLYGLSIDEFNDMFAEQNGCCAICGKHQVALKYRLGIDHNHLTGKARGLLCKKCNMGIGLFDDNIDRLFCAMTYLRKNAT